MSLAPIESSRMRIREPGERSDKDLTVVGSSCFTSDVCQGLYKGVAAF